MYLWLCFPGIDDDDAIDDLPQPSEEDMPVLEGDEEDTSRMEEVD